MPDKPPLPQTEIVLERLMEQVWRALAAMPSVLLALLVLWLAWRLGRWLSGRALLVRASSRNPFLRELGQTTVRWVATSIGLVAALEIMNATALVGAVLGTAGVLGVVLGFAFKDTLENYLAGILMSLRQPFAPRDHLVIDGNEGIVVAMTSRATILMTPDGNHLRLPNALVFRSVTLNYTRNPSRRFSFNVGIGVEEDLVAAQRIGIDEMGAVDGVTDQPPPRAYIAALGDSNVQMTYHGWVDQRSHDFLAVKSEAIRRVKLALEAGGMDMPEPIYRVQLTERREDGAPVQPKRPTAPTAPGAPATAPTPHHRSPSQAAPVDTRAQRELVEQIEADQRRLGSADLLDPQAPQE